MNSFNWTYLPNTFKHVDEPKKKKTMSNLYKKIFRMIQMLPMIQQSQNIDNLSGMLVVLTLLTNYKALLMEAYSSGNHIV